MKILRPGHRYELDNFENKAMSGQILQFIEKMPIAGDSEGALATTMDGTTNEELLAVLIDRMRHLQNKFPCRENAVALTHFETGLMWLESRTKDRQARGVEGKQLV